jgi:hypothetical protein
MKTKVLLCMLAVATLFATPGVGAQTSSLDPQLCLAEESRQVTNEYYWRWRAYQDLGCLMSKLEQAMNGPANIGKDHVTLPRGGPGGSEISTGGQRRHPTHRSFMDRY